MYGSMGLFWNGEWDRCQAAVDAVMMGSEINSVVAVSSDSQGADLGVFAACDIRHVARDQGQVGETEKEQEKDELSKVRGKGRFKRSGKVIKPKARVGWVDSSALWKPVQEFSESESAFSGETVEASLANRLGYNGDQDANRTGKEPVNLNLSLGQE